MPPQPPQLRLLSLLSLLLLLALAPSALSAVVSLLVSPSLTDPSITTNLDNHACGLDPILAASLRAQGKTRGFLHLPGTGGVPANSASYLRTAAELGYLVLGLSYPNDVTIGSLCSYELSFSRFLREWRLRTPPYGASTVLVRNAAVGDAVDP